MVERRKSGFKWPVLEQKKSALLGRDLVEGKRKAALFGAASFSWNA